MKRGSKPNEKGRPGDVIAIPLTAAGYAYGKLFADYGLGVYDLLTASIADCEEVTHQKFWFFCHIFHNAIKSGMWPIIGHEPFSDEESSWTPPMFHQDVISGEYEIRHKGECRPATKKEIRGLFEEVMYFPDGLLERIEAERERG
jgi:hypothetical protein